MTTTTSNNSLDHDEWLAAIPLAKRIAKAMSLKYGYDHVEDLEQELLLLCPSTPQDDWKRAFSREASRIIRNKDPLGISTRRGNKDGYPTWCHISAITAVTEKEFSVFSDDDSFGDRLPGQCVWCGADTSGNVSSKFCHPRSKACAVSFDYYRKVAVPFLIPMHALLTNGPAKAEQLKAITPNFLAVLKLLERLGYTFRKFKPRRNGCRPTCYEITEHGIALPC